MKTAFKKMLSIAITICLILTFLPVAYFQADAEVPGYSVSSSYKSSSYYTALCNVALTGNQREDIVNVALSQVGYKEGSAAGDYSGADDGSYNNYTEYNYWYHNYVNSGMPVGGSETAPWCATFVSWCAEQANIPASVLKRSTRAGHGSSCFNVKFYSGSSTLASSSDNDSYFMGYQYTPKKGDLFFTRSWSHVGLVVGVNGSKVITVEGNTNNNGSSQGNGVYKLSWRNISDLYFGVPDYAGVPDHTCDKGTYMYYEAAHPHYKCYKCSVCGNIWRNTEETVTVSTCDTCNPVSVSSKYSGVLSFKSYLKNAETVYPCSSAQLAETTGGQIWSTDECTITAVYSNGACKVTYPAGSTTKTAYTSLSNFLCDTSSALTKQTVNHTIKTYIRASTSSTVYGQIDSGDTVYKVGTSGSMTQLFYPVSSGYKLAWVLTSDLTEQTYDTRFNPYCPIKTYPCATSTFDAYASDYTTDIGDIWTSDYCTINAVYADGWCNVTYPVSGGTKTGYTKLSNFVYNVSATPVKYTATAQTVVSTTTSLSTELGKIFAGDVFYVVSTYGSLSQVLYPLDSGGYKMGWMSTSALPKTAYTVSYNANGGSGAPSAQTKTHGVALTLSSTVPTRTGYTFVGWSTSSSATSANYAPGASYTADANLALYAVWTLNKYEISYDANGGTGAPAIQNKTHGTALTLSATVPAKYYTVTFHANGGSVNTTTRQVTCEFLGWATSSTATSATYQPGGSFTTNANTTLYAVWQDPMLNQYSIPVRAGYVFDGWYTAASGGSQVTATTVITKDMTVYAHWAVATYCIEYDANGGTGEPDPQVKTHGVNLTLSSVKPTKTGYTFTGWAASSTATSAVYQPGGTFTANEDTILYAVWEKGCESGAHSYSYQVTKTPTASATGTLTGTCTNCSGTTTVTLPKLNTTDYAYSVVSTASCTKAGTGRYTWKTTTYGNFYFDVSIATIGHHYSGGTCTECGAQDPNAQSSSAKYEMNDATGTVGSTVDIYVSIANNPGIVSLRNQIIYDTSALTLISVQDCGLLNGYTTPSATVNSPYTLRWADSLATQNNFANGRIVKLSFLIKDGTQSGDYSVSVSHVEARTKDGEKITFGTATATVHVTDFLLGDVDGDGEITDWDAIVLERYLAGWDVEIVSTAADIDGDGEITDWDAIVLQRYLAGWDISLES